MGGFSAEEEAEAEEARTEMEKQPPYPQPLFCLFYQYENSLFSQFSVAFAAAASNCVWHSCPVFSPLGSSLEAMLF